MAYWGMAMANIDNATRAKKFMAECVKHKAGLSERETMYIDALDAYFKADGNKRKERNEAYTRALEKILYKYPDDIEARAFLALQLWKNRDSGIPITSHLAIDALHRPGAAGRSAAPGPSLPHSPVGHRAGRERRSARPPCAGRVRRASPTCGTCRGTSIRELKRYDDACWQQEASARVDHAHMMRDRVLPDQIHNFAHNNEWLIRDLIFVGRMHDAIDLAKNMIELPRHPKYNTLDEGQRAISAGCGCSKCSRGSRCGTKLIALADTPYLEPTDNEDEQVKRLRALGKAHYRRGDAASGDAVLGRAAATAGPM